MRAAVQSSAPHLYPASRWKEFAAYGDQLILARGREGDSVEVGVRRWRAGHHPFSSENHTVCFIQQGSGVFRRIEEAVHVEPGALIHFKSGWSGVVEVADLLDASYMTCMGAPGTSTPILRNALSAEPLKDWGAIPTMLRGDSTTAGILLSRDPDKRAESGIWTCTPGYWRCEVTSDEYCHFLAGSCTYVHESGEEIEIRPDTLAFFPEGWKGTCEVHETVCKVYLIR